VCLIDRAKREVVAGGEKEVEASVENFREVVDHGDATDYASGRENSGLSKATYAHSSDDESSCTYCFGASTITLDQIREMAEKGNKVLQSMETTKLSSSRTSSSRVCISLHTPRWRRFY
jgi:hypothetical protein